MSYIHDTKRNFINYFLKTYQLSQRESIWILNLIRKNDFLLKKVEFVDLCSIGDICISMKTIGHSGFDISFYSNGNFVTNNPSEIYMFFESLCLPGNAALDNIKTIHIQLNFNKKDSDPEYLYIKGENSNIKLTKSFSLPKLENESQISFPFIAVKELEIDIFLAKLSKDYTFKKYKELIDESLDTKDKVLFLEILNEINELNFSIFDILKSEDEN